MYRDATVKGIQDMVVCHNPACGATHVKKARTAKHCPCKQADYCDKECQQADWGQHKRHYTYYLGKQKMKQAQKKNHQQQRREKN